MREKLPIKIAIAVAFIVAVWLLWPTGSDKEANLGGDSELAMSSESARDLVSNIQPISEADASPKRLEGNEEELEQRFSKAMNTIGSGDIDRAITELNGLIADYPQVIEPYINLASLYASDDQFDLSRATLERAIKANPNTATLFDSVRKVYGAQAARAYRLALSDQDEVVQKLPQPELVLPLIESIDTREARATAATMALDEVDNEIAESAATIALLKEQLEAAEVKHRAEVAALREQLAALDSAVANRESEPLSEVAVSNEPAQGDDENGSVATEPQQNISLDEVAENLVTSWAKHWSDQNVQGYVSHYTQGYVPRGSDLSHAQWLEQRQVRLTNKRFIKVDVSNFSVQDDQDQFAVTFTQHYQSNTVDDTIRKRLVFAKRGDDLSNAKIVGEQVVRR